jgi:hypothetical protein
VKDETSVEETLAEARMAVDELREEVELLKGEQNV